MECWRGERGRRWCREQPFNARDARDAKGAQAFFLFFLKPGTLWRGQRSEVGGQGEPNSRTAARTDSDKHGRTRTVGEGRGQRSGKTGTAEQPFNARDARDAKGSQAFFVFLGT